MLRDGSSMVREALLRIRMLFKLEEEWTDLAPKQRHDRRQRVSRPMLDDFFAWADGVFARVRDIRGPVATAFGYAIRQRDALRRFLDDGRLRLENNAVERAIRGVVVGRKNHYGSRSKRGTEVAAVFYSLIESAKLSGVDPAKYLRAAAEAALDDREPPLPREFAGASSATA